MWNEFKKFAFKGNVVDLAVGVVIGAAFGKIVSSLVKDIITPLLGMVLGGVDFTDLHFGYGKSAVMYGNFIQTIFDFLIIAASIFMFVKVFNKLTSKKEEEEKEEEIPEPTKEEVLLGEIRDLLKQQNSSKDRA
ncbi:TPA: large conductance mechanosensitive channel protein MscL [Bacillus thuringiensis]|jgi:large conductance mechanosensitive channel|uniref:Large-conductance mechanosensitive channel n=3 Tax=Bacillus cereus group TaxID=86661 RepID=A0A9X6QB27_BACTU|nr:MULTISPECIES: large conductance mechanosensitive channel protein MscL [Bacillus]MCU7391928.1 large conductance mechanosensitive channel protein MscL [Bacillus sp. ST24]NIE90403.1 large conductance mechanosensitive channel protein MscL [Bacillus sp. Ab-1751]AGE80559.1 large conductance mechanosensitive channel protein [Bacillus thuringiensis serovar kurstaki str. HD73]AHZ53518.1 large-conductance mechanosensitive channel [Bacillus thuringiensis serovar kurstaki str. YBT-1520]AIE35948.1 large